MKKFIIAVLAAILIPALCWGGMNPYIAGIVRSSNDSGYTTTVFSYNFDVTDGSDPTSIGAPIDTWTSEVDADSDGNISSNTYILTIDDTNQIYLSKTITQNNKVQLQFDFKYTPSTLLSAYDTYFDLALMRSSSSNLVGLRMYRNTTSCDKFRVYYSTDDGTVYYYQDYTFSPDTWYSLTLTFEIASGDGDDNGVIRFAVNGVLQMDITTLNNDTIAGCDTVVCGQIYTRDTSISGYVTLDNVKVKTP